MEIFHGPASLTRAPFEETAVTIFDLSAALGLRQLTSLSKTRLRTDVGDILVCDLLSHVLARGGPGTVWITVQTHQNVIAVARVLDFSMVVVPDSVPVPLETAQRADAALMPMYSTQLSAYDLCCRLFSLGFDRARRVTPAEDQS